MKKLPILFLSASLLVFASSDLVAQGQLNQKKDSKVDTQKSKVQSESKATQLRAKSNTNSSTVPAKPDQISTPIRWYAIENSENEAYWKGVDPGRIWLELELGQTLSNPDIAAFLSAYNLEKVLWESWFKKQTNYWIFENPNPSKDQVVQMAKAAQQIEGILFLEPSVIYKQSMIPNDPLWEQQWGPYASYFDEAWDYGTGGNSQNVVAVIDDACDWNHEDLYDQVWYGYDYVYGSFDITPHMAEQDHGTHVTGTAAATINNGIGVAGMVNDTVYFAKIADDQNQFVDAAIVNALYDISSIDRITVINMSLGADVPSTAMEQACNTAWNSGKLPIVASGNNGQGFIGFPAAYLSCVAIGSVGTNGTNIYLTNYSQWGNEQELCASGGDEQAGFSIISTLPGNSYGTKDGTSMAAPHVTGLAGLLKNLNPSLTNVDLRNIMAATAFDMGDAGWDQFHGYGLINAVGAVQSALGVVSSTTPQGTRMDQFSLYPNPSSSTIFVDFKDVSGNVDLAISDVTGKEVQTLNLLNPDKVQIDLSDLHSGVYILRTNSQNGTQTARFVKP